MSQLENNSQNVFNNDGFLDENDPNTPKKKRRRRPNPVDEESKDNVDDLTNDTPKRRRRRRRKDQDSDGKPDPTNHLGVAAYLEDLQEDIEVRAADEDISTIEQFTLSKGVSGTYQGIGDTVYVEGARKFRPENQEKYMKDKLKESQRISDKLNITEDRHENDLMDCVLTITERFRILAVFVHGLFAGLVLMFTVFSLIATTFISNSTVITGILSLYNTIQQPFSVFNYLMFVLIIVSIMDRCNFGQPSSNCNQNQGGMILALVLLMVSFIINNSLYFFEPYFNLSKTNTSYTASLLTQFTPWAIVDAVKSVLVCLAWFIVAILPVYDKYVETLRQEMKEGENDENSSDRR